MTQNLPKETREFPAGKKPIGEINVLEEKGVKTPLISGKNGEEMESPSFFKPPKTG